METTNPTNSQPAVPPAPAAPEKKGMPAWAIVLIILGSLFLLGLIAFFILSASIVSCFKNADFNVVEDDNGLTITPSDDSTFLNGGPDSGSDTTAKGGCKFYECLSNFTDKSTVTEVTAKIGFEPTKTSKPENSFDTYIYTFDDKHTIEMTVSRSTGNTISIELGEYVKDELKQSGVTFANAQTIKSNLNVGDGISYDEFKQYMGGVDGILVEVGSWNKYEWRSTTEDGYVTASFSDSGKCMSFFGML